MPSFSAAKIAPSHAQRAGNQACSIHKIAAHIAASLSNTPIHALPNSSPIASTTPCAGGYIDEYVGSQFTWNVSKLRHNGCVGFVHRPCANVSPINK